MINKKVYFKDDEYQKDDNELNADTVGKTSSRKYMAAGVAFASLLSLGIWLKIKHEYEAVESEL